MLLKDFQANIPAIRLMGAAFGNVMLPSKLAATHIVPCAEQTRHIVQHMYDVFDPPLFSEEAWPKARDLLFNDGPLTRKDDARDLTRQRFANPGNVALAASTSGDTGEDERQKGQQMIYYVECIPPGTWLVQQLYSKLPLDQLELGCLFDGLAAFLDQPSIGGRSAAGYGQVRVMIRGTVDTENISWPGQWTEKVSKATEAYRNHLKEKQADILKALTAQKQKAGA